MSLNVFKFIYSLFVKENKLIHFNDFILIVFNFKSRLGKEQELSYIINVQFLLFLIGFNKIMINHFFLLYWLAGSYCEEFNAELCQDLIAMIHDNIPKFTNFEDYEIHNLRITIDDFKIIILFIRQLKVNKNKKSILLMRFYQLILKYYHF